MKELIDIGQPEWVEISDTKVMHFKADKWHDKIRVEFAIGIPFESCFFVDLKPKEARVLAAQLMKASDNTNYAKELK